jgi:hypothetical protein
MPSLAAWAPEQGVAATAQSGEAVAAAHDAAVGKAAMSFFKQILEGSLLSRERLMEAREFYVPFARESSGEAAFARWTQRVSAQSELGISRELAGLPDDELAALEREFVRCPMRRQSPWVGPAVAAGAVLVLLACLGLGLGALSDLGPSVTRALQTASVIALLVGLSSLASALLSAFANVHPTLAHGTLGLYVGTLDEQHPWLYSAVSLTRHHIAESYRQRTLAERGRLRGVDVVMMRELVDSQQALQRVRPARALAAQLQLLPIAAEAVPPEPRLVQVGNGRDLRPATPRPFGSEDPRPAVHPPALARQHS